MAAEGMQFPWRWNGGTIFPNLDVIWGMSVQLFDANHIKQDWLPTLSGDEILLRVIPARDLSSPKDLAIDPGFVKLGWDYRLRSDSMLLKHFTSDPLPGAFPVAGARTGSTYN